MRLSSRRALLATALSSLLLVGTAAGTLPSATATPPAATAAEESESPAATATGTPPATPTEPPAETSAAPSSEAPTTTAPSSPATSTTPEPAPAAAAEASSAAASGEVVHSDLVVYGGTPAGVAAAIAATEQGARATLFVERSTVGGMMSNGISASDIGSPLAVQGLAKRFFDRIRRYYRDPATWRFEPKVAERVLRGMLAEAGVAVHYRAPLESVRVLDGRIRCAEFADGATACADSFIDASYTGDLIEEAGVPNRLGMGDFFSYPGEKLAAMRGWTKMLEVDTSDPVALAAAEDAFDDNPFVSVEPSLEDYSTGALSGSPSIAYRLCVTKRASNKVPFQKAASYAALEPSFKILASSLRPGIQQKSNGTLLSDIFHLAVIPGGKYDLNAGKYTNLPAPAGYFDRDADRVALDRQVRDYVESFFWFAQNDASVAPELRAAWAPFGLCADEFTDNGGWPREPYVREGRRLVGRYTVTENDVLRSREKPTSIAVASYNLDSKISRMVFADGALYHDVPPHSTAPTYEIPYEAMLPEAGSVTNLLVPVGVSASPVAFGSIRMEPQWMALAEAAGIAAALATRERTTVAAVPVSQVQRTLDSRGVLHTAPDICRKTPAVFRPAGGYTPYCQVLAVEPRLV